MQAFIVVTRGAALCALLAALVACGGKSLAPYESASSESKAAAQGYKVVYSFRGRDGTNPLASLIDVGGTLYGTASQGGAHNGGTVFSITPSGSEHVLYSFKESDAAGYYPGAALLNVNGTFYGTTELGGKTISGAVFSITPGGHVHVLYSFGSTGPSGSQPSASLINVNGILYSTTSFGGLSNLGTAFSVTTTGGQRTLHSFGHPYQKDGQIPSAALLEMNGVLYGTTYQGGLYHRGNSCSGFPCPGDGTVFRLTSAGKEHVLHSFGNSSDGVNPQASLTNLKGTLYGTTDHGGTSNDGTIFTVTPDGAEKIVYSFKGKSDGAIPEAAVIEVDGKLYGTTLGAGAFGPYGTVFTIKPDGSGEEILHSFGSGNDGRAPEAGLVNVDGTLYGTTSSGGAYGKGTVFALPLPR